LAADSEPFIVDESSLDLILDRPQRLAAGVILLCLSGKADIMVDMNQCSLTAGMQAILFPNEICMLTGRTEDFNVLFFSFSYPIFKEASYRIAADYFGFLKENFCVLLPQHGFNMNVDTLRIAKELYHDTENRFREKMIINVLQNYLFDSYDKISRFHSQVEIRESDRKNKLFKQFVNLIHKHCTHIREVGFYANELSISSRYLSTIARKNDKRSAKAFIDDCVTQEIKLLLHSTDLSIQEIADKLNFPDQSYLGRFFKRQTGMSPKEYRKQE